VVHRTIILSLLLTIGLSWLEPISAAEGSGEDGYLDDEYSVIVTAKRREEPSLNATRMIGTVDARAIEENGVASMADTLVQSVGVFVQRTNRGAGAPIIRGLVGPQNLIMVDGVRFNTTTFRTGPNQYLQLFDPQAVGQLEVLRGPSSVLYGSGAMGGVLQILPKRRAFKVGTGTSSSIRIRSADVGTSLSSDLWTGNTTSQLSLGLSYDHPGELRAGRGFMEPMSEHEKVYWRSQVKHRWGALELNASYFGARIDDAGRADKLGLGDVRLYDNVDHFSFVRLKYHGQDLLDEISLTFNHHRLDEGVQRSNCVKETNADGHAVVADPVLCAAQADAVLTRKRFYDDRVDSFGGSLLASLEPFEDRFNIVTGAEFYQDFVSSQKRTGEAEDDFELVTAPRGNFSDGSWFRSFSAFAHGDLEVHRIGELAFAVNGGARYSYFQAYAPDLPELGDVSYDYRAPVFSGGIQAKYGDWLNIYGTFAQGFRSPNLQETTVLGDTGSKFEVPNADLGPERSDTYEIGLKLRTDRVSFNLAGFYGLLHDVIDEVPSTYQGGVEVDGAPVVQRVNEARGLVKGLEGELSLRFGDFALFSGATWMDGDIESASGDKHPMRRIPPIFGYGGLRYNPGKGRFVRFSARWALSQEELHPSDLKDHRICQTDPYSGVLNPECSGTPGWLSLDLDAGIELDSHLSIFLSGHNLLDRQYRTHGSGFFAPGIDVRVSARVQF
jgi:outer membrane receptor protein involved in Fe transport